MWKRTIVSSPMDIRISCSLLAVIIALMPECTESLSCVQCTTDDDNGSSKNNCLDKPGPPEKCPENVGYCVVITEYAKKATLSIFEDHDIINGNNRSLESSSSTFGNLLFVGRSCMSYNAGDSCDEGSRREEGGDRGKGRKVVVCKRYCTSDGCNAGVATADAITIADASVAPFMVICLLMSTKYKGMC